jgi:hypothetical protein
MADKLLDSDKIVFRDQWGGAPIRIAAKPKDGFDGAEHFNVASAQFPLGTAVQVVHKGTAGKTGYSTFRYLKVGTQNASVAIAVRKICTQEGTTPFVVTNDPDTVAATTITASGLCAVALGAMTNAYHGFFWTGGVCPEDEVSGLGTTYPTDDSVTAGHDIKLVNLAADEIGFGLAETTGTGASTAMSICCGYALGADGSVG